MTASPNATAFVTDLRAILREGAEEVMGLDEVTALFERILSDGTLGSDACGELARMQSFLEEEFGHPAARGLALRVGRAGFRRGLKCWGHSAGLLEPSFRLLPSGKRIFTGLKAMAVSLEAMFGLSIEVGQTDTHWTWRLAKFEENGSFRSRPFCSLMVGTLQEFLSWAGSGRVYQVLETECTGQGAPACLIVVDKKPLD